jgi:SAM-dependent methyltransferase
VSERGRRPTSHERREGRPWDASYAAGTAPWDIGEPQPAIARLVAEGAFAGAVLDAGCGTGEHALRIAAQGLRVLGVDLAETAISLAREKAASRGIGAEFAVADALELDRLGRMFDTVLDVGLFHTFDADERRAYVAGLAAVTRPGATLHVLCFRDEGPEVNGPHPVTEDAFRAPFEAEGGWQVAALAHERIRTTFSPEGPPAWLGRVKRT